MLSRLCSLKCFNQNILPVCSRKFSLNLIRPSRFTRSAIRERLNKKAETLKNIPNSVNNQTYTDSIPLRLPRHLWLAFGFATTTGFLFYHTAAFFEVERLDRERHQVLDPQSIFIDFKRFLQGDPNAITHHPQQKFTQEPLQAWNNMTRAQSCVLAITALNVLVTVLWRIKPLNAVLSRYFTSSFASKSLCSPMLLSVFSHKSGLHLFLNMYALWTFAPATINKFLGVEQFLAFYLTGGVVSSLVSLVHKRAILSTVRSLGASGAILAVLIYVCMKIPDARLRIVFLPFFDFSAESAVYGIILFDLIGLFLGFRIFDHAAHLGGSLFGLLYVAYGENWYRTRILPAVAQAYRNVKSKDSHSAPRRKSTRDD